MLAMSEFQALEFENLVRRRSSCRVPFNPLWRMSDRYLERLLEAARWAPTPHNMQNFEIVVVRDPKVLTEISEVPSTPSEVFLRENYEQLAFSREELQRKATGLLAEMFPPSWRSPDPKPDALAESAHAFLGRSMQSAPMLLIVLYDTRRRAPASEGDALGLMGLGCVMQNLWLMANALGFGFQILSTFGGGDVENAVSRILDIPAHMRIAFACRIGYPDSMLDGCYPRVRREVQEFTHYNRYGSRGPI